MFRGTQFLSPGDSFLHLRCNLGGHLGDKITKKTAKIQKVNQKSAKTPVNFNT